MKRTWTFSLVLGAAVVAATGAGAYWWGMQRGMQMTSLPGAVGDVASGGAASPDATRRVLYWHDPMVPGPRFDKPGKSPFMNMMLEPVYADAGADEGKVTISPRVQQNLGIRTAPVTRGAMAPTLDVTGTVAFNERDVVVVQARANGFVEKLWVRAPLDTVRAGQPLAELYVPDWVAAQEEYLAVIRMQSGGLDAVIDGARQRMRLAGMSEAQIGQVTERGTQVHRLTVDAPRGGIVTELGVREGMAVAMGATLFRINGLSTVWINAEVPEAAAVQVRPGQAVEVRAPALPGHRPAGPRRRNPARREPGHSDGESAGRGRQSGGAVVAGLFRHRERGARRARRGADGPLRGGHPHRNTHRRVRAARRRQVRGSPGRDGHGSQRNDRDSRGPGAGPASGDVRTVPRRLRGEPQGHHDPHG